MGIMTAKAVLPAGGNPVVIFAECFRINVVAVGAQHCRVLFQQLGSSGLVMLMTEAALTLGGWLMGDALLPESINLMTREAKLWPFLQQVGRLIKPMAAVAGDAVQHGHRLVDGCSLAGIRRLFLVAPQAECLTVADQQGRFICSMSQVAVITPALLEGLMLTCCPVHGLLVAVAA